MNSKTYALTYEEYEKSDKSAKELIEMVLEDKELPRLEEIIIGSWADSWESSCQEIIDTIIANKEKFAHIRSLFIGDMDFEECEVSWILQGNYEGLLQALPNLESLTIKGSTELSLGKLESKSLKKLEIICGGLPQSVFEDIQQADLPQLEKLNLYLGIEDYGCDIDKESLETFLKEANFPHLKYLGLNDSEWQDEIVDIVCKSKYMKQLEVLDFSNGTLTDEGGEILLKVIPQYENIKKVDMHYHYMSEAMMKKLGNLPCEVDVSEGEDPDDEYICPMLTE